MASALQEGIYHAPGMRPGAAFGIVFLQDTGEGRLDQIGQDLKFLWDMLQELKQGIVRDLPGQTTPAGNLTCLIGYGVKAFEIAGALRQVPGEISRFGRFRSPLTSGGGPLLLGSGQIYADDVKKNPATEIVAVQFIADSSFAVNRAIVETWKLLHDRSDAGGSLSVAGFFQGFQRDDHRSWIDFHDGVSNLRSQEREGVITVKDGAGGADDWTIGGTYMAYIRCAVDLSIWRRFNRAQQELLVGRDKLSGCPLEHRAARIAPIAGCPIVAGGSISDAGNEGFFEPPNIPEDKTLAKSHVQRANHHVAPSDSPNSLRIFRQGYEFLEPADGAPGFRLGLNFVSFQDTPGRLFRMLTQQGWLGNTNFGGDPNSPVGAEARLLTTRAAGVFLVPPIVDGELFPGSSIFTAQAIHSADAAALSSTGD